MVARMINSHFAAEAGGQLHAVYVCRTCVEGFASGGDWTMEGNIAF